MYEDIKEKFKGLEDKLSEPEITQNPQKLAEVSQEHSFYKKVVDLIAQLEKIDQDIKENEEIVNSEQDEEMTEMAQEELQKLRPRKEELEEKIEEELYPDDPNDKKNVIMEIRAGTGGEESTLFASELFRMYSRLAEHRGWKVEILSSSESDLGGYKEIIFMIKGENVYKNLKFEGGTHRVQRVPETEKSGRIHTSAATVAVLPEAEDVELDINENELRIDTYSASGPGGQSVNTSNSAVRITHEPTGIIAQCQDEKSQQQNKLRALQILRARLMAKIQEEKEQNETEERKTQVGTGDRSEKIRTYNFPQDRITDHRIKKSWNNLESILDGNVDDIIDSLIKANKELNSRSSKC